MYHRNALKAQLYCSNTFEIKYSMICVETDEILRNLGILQISDSFLPTGMYSMSSGLEMLASIGAIPRKSLVEFISVQIAQQIGPCDCIILGCVMDAAAAGDAKRIAEIDQVASAIKTVRVAREASRSSGTQLLRVSERICSDKLLSEFAQLAANDSTPCMYPVAFGVCAHALKIDKVRAGLSLLYGFAVSMVGAALRLGLIHHFDGQEIIHELKLAIADASKYTDSSMSEIWQFAPQAEILQMKHEARDSKMFIT